MRCLRPACNTSKIPARPHSRCRGSPAAKRGRRHEAAAVHPTSITEQPDGMESTRRERRPRSVGESWQAAEPPGSRRDPPQVAGPVGTPLRLAPRQGRRVRDRIRPRRFPGGRARRRGVARGVVARGDLDRPGAGEGRRDAFRRVPPHDGPRVQLGAVLHRFRGDGQRGPGPERGDSGSANRAAASPRFRARRSC